MASMLLTSRDVCDSRFDVRGFGPWRGYDTDEVDDLLFQVEVTLTVLERELMKYRKEESNGTEN